LTNVNKVREVDASAGILLNHAVVDIPSPMNSTRFADGHRIELISNMKSCCFVMPDTLQLPISE